MIEEDFKAFQRQELTVTFANGFRLTAPMSHWLGALIQELNVDAMNRVSQRVLAYQQGAPIEKAKIHLPPSMRDLEEACNHG